MLYDRTLLILVIILLGFSILILIYTWGKAIKIDMKSLQYSEEMLRNINELGYKSDQVDTFLMKNDKIIVQSMAYMKSKKENIIFHYEI